MALPSAPFTQLSLPDAPFLKTDLQSSDAPDLNAAVTGSGVIPTAVSGALAQVASTPGMQPFTSLKEALPIPTSATGDPVTDILASAQHIAEFPFRLSQTMGSLSGPADEVAKTHAEALGLHPSIAWVLGKAAGIAVDPRNLAMFGEGGIPNAKGVDFPKIGPMGGAETEARAAQAASYGIDLSPAEATKSKIVNVLEDLGNIYPYTGDDFQNFYHTRMAQADNIRARLMDSLGNSKSTQQVSEMMKSQIMDYLDGATPEHAAYLQDKFGDLETYMKKPVAGQFTQSMLAQQRDVALKAAGQHFDDLRTIVPPEVPVQGSSFAAKAKEFLNQELDSKPSDRNQQWVKRLAEYAGVKEVPGMDLGEAPTGAEASNLATLIRKQMGGEDSGQTMSYGSTQMTMRKLRDLRISNDPGYLLGIKGQGNTYAGYAAELRSALHEDIGNALGKLSDQAKQVLKEQPPTDPAIVNHLNQMAKVSDMYGAAKTNYAKTKELMNDPFIIKLLKNNPEEFLNHAVKPQDITNIGKLKEILGPDNFAPVQQNLMANMLVDKTGELNPNAFVKKVNQIGFPTLSKVFDPKTVYEIGQAQDVFSTMKRGFVEGSQTGGRLMAKAALFGVPAQAFHLLMSGEPVAAAGVLAGAIGVPKALARMYLSETGRDMLIHGIAMPDKAATALSILGKTAMMSGSENARASATPAGPQ